MRGGSIAGRAGERRFDTTIVFGPDGAEAARCRRIHLCDAIAPDGTGYRESATCGVGGEVVTVAIGGMQAGLATCCGLRLPGPFPELRRRGAERVFPPSVCTLQAGEDHREPLIRARARAIEARCRIAAPAVTGAYSDAKGRLRPAYDRSMNCGPWGHVVARCPDGPGAATARVDPAPVARVRRDMPVMEHRRRA